MGKHSGSHSNSEAAAIYSSLSLSLYCVAAEWFFYGIYVVLFFFCIYTLRRSGKLPHRRWLTIAVSVIFVFCTTHWILQLTNAGMFIAVKLQDAKIGGQPHRHDAKRPMWNRINIAMGVLYVTSNIVADGIFVFRCYGIWGCRKRFVAVPVVMTVVSGGLGYAAIITCGIQSRAQFLFINSLFPLAVVFSVLTNTMLMALTAGRIWWIARGATMLMGPAVVRQYKTVVAMILESGALYVTPALLYLALFQPEPASTLVILSSLAQIVGIAPTIIVVRVGLSNTAVKSVRDVEESILDIRPGLDIERDEDQDLYKDSRV